MRRIPWAAGVALTLLAAPAGAQMSSPPASAERPTHPVPPPTQGQTGQDNAAGAAGEPSQVASGGIRGAAMVALISAERAQRALMNKDYNQAEEMLDVSAQHLESLYDAAPAAQLTQEFDNTQHTLQRQVAVSKKERANVNMEPLISEMKQNDQYLDPKVVDQTKKAIREQNDGKSDKAVKELANATQRLDVDVARWPLEDAYSRVVAAQVALRDGEPERAERLLGGARDSLVENARRAPLVPVRFDLRGAAAALERNNHAEAEQLIARASDNLRDLGRTFRTPVPESLVKLTSRVSQAEQQLALGKDVSPSKLRDLAAETNKLARSRQG